MEIHGEQTLLTPSEADWLHCGSFYEMPGLAQRILEARLAFAAQHTAPEEMQPIRALAATTQNEPQMHILLSFTLTPIEARHATNPDGTEIHIHEIAMSGAELTWAHTKAAREQTLTRDKLMHYDKTQDENRTIAEVARSLGVDLDILSLDEALYLEDLDRDPEFQAASTEHDFTQALATLNITSGIIRAIDAARGQ